MLRLGFWQLDRAEQKQTLLDQVQQRAQAAALTPSQLLNHYSEEEWVAELRFHPIKVTGEYLADRSVLVENVVLNKRGGYQLFTPIKLTGTEQLILVSRGWLPLGATRQELPQFSTPEGTVSIKGRLNLPPARPPLWKDGYPVSEGFVWQYIPIDEYASQNRARVLPLVVELAPENEGSQGVEVHWQAINDEWVAKHKGYAFQWFAMAVAFFMACVFLLFRRFKSKL